jgi:prepilin-type N-terminal cleavage/methylation domain-containing protein
MIIKAKSLGFSLIELLIVISMMALISGALIYNFRQGDMQKRVNLTVDTLILALRQAQDYTFAGKLIPPTTAAPFVRGTSCGSATTGLQPASYWVEIVNQTTFDIMGEATCGGIFRIQRYTTLQNTEFPQVSPYTLTTINGTSSPLYLSIRFLPPFATMTASSVANPTVSSFSQFNTATITVQYKDGAKTRNLNIDGISGKIE